MIGPAGGEEYETGNYYGTPTHKTSVVAGLKQLLGDSAQVDFAQGVGFVEQVNTLL